MKKSNNISSVLENELYEQVSEKQELVGALEKEKNTLTNALKLKLKEIKKEKMKVKRRIKNDQELFGPPMHITPVKNRPMPSTDTEALKKRHHTLQPPTQTSSVNAIISNSIISIVVPIVTTTVLETIPPVKIEFSKAVEECDKRIEILQRDNEYYQLQSDKTIQKIVTLTKQLEDAKEEANRYRAILDEANKNAIQIYKKGDFPAIPPKPQKIDSSMDSL